MQPFLTANWRYLAMLNYVVDPKIVAPLVPPGTEIDFENGETFLSVVGFLFLDTRLLGLPIPLHRDFEEVNLRFYVRKKSADTWRRGVVFVRELVPRRAIAIVARTFYGEHYLAVPMKHDIDHVDLKLSVEYSWRRGRKWESLQNDARAANRKRFPPVRTPNSSPNITGATLVSVAVAANTALNIRAGKFGTRTALNSRPTSLHFTASNSSKRLQRQPRSAFIADGSPIQVLLREQLS